MNQPSTRSDRRSEEHTSELQARVDISYAVFCLKKETCGVGVGGVHGRPRAAFSHVRQRVAGVGYDLVATDHEAGVARAGVRRVQVSLVVRRAPRSPLFPYPTLFGS